MIHPPRTRAEARKCQYGSSLWGKTKFNPKRCAQEVSSGTRAPTYHQCDRKPGHGPDELYCRQHDPAAIAARREKQQRAYNTRLDNQLHPYRERETAIAHLRSVLNAIEAMNNGDQEWSRKKIVAAQKFLKKVKL